MGINPTSLYTIDNLASRFGISRETVSRLVKEGKLQPILLGKRMRFTEAECERFIESLPYHISTEANNG